MRERERAGLVLTKEPKGRLGWGTDATPIGVSGMSPNHIRGKTIAVIYYGSFKFTFQPWYLYVSTFNKLWNDFDLLIWESHPVKGTMCNCNWRIRWGNGWKKGNKFFWSWLMTRCHFLTTINFTNHRNWQQLKILYKMFDKYSHILWLRGHRTIYSTCRILLIQ